MTEIVDPTLAQPIGTPPMVHPEMVRAMQNAGIDPQQMQMPVQEASEPFASFHGPEASQEIPAPEPAVVTELTDAERAEFATLMTIGRRTKTIAVFDHPVVIESLTVGDDQRIGLYCKDFKDAPPADSRSYQIAVCACAIRTVDGRPLYQAFVAEGNEDEVFHEKIEKIRSWYPAVVTEIYRAVLDLDREFAELADKLGKLKG